MRALIQAFAAAGVLAVAAPASALTLQAVSAGAPAGVRLADPDAALEGAGAGLRTAIAGGSESDGPAHGSTYLNGPPADLADYEARYAADPSGFVARASERGSAADAASTGPAPAGAAHSASKAPAAVRP